MTLKEKNGSFSECVGWNWISVGGHVSDLLDEAFLNL